MVFWQARFKVSNPRFSGVSCSTTSFKTLTFLPDFEQNASTGTATLISSQQQLAQVKSTTRISVYAWEKAKPRRETYLLQGKKNSKLDEKFATTTTVKNRQGTLAIWELHVVLFSFLRRDVSLFPHPYPLPGKTCFAWLALPPSGLLPSQKG